jgi:hypothetical protein
MLFMNEAAARALSAAAAASSNKSLNLTAKPRRFCGVCQLAPILSVDQKFVPRSLRQASLGVRYKVFHLWGLAVNVESNQSIFHARVMIAVTFLGLLLACTVNVWTFRTFFDRSYVEWYSNAGPFIAIATAAFGAAWGGLDKNPALVSANPLAYFGACLQVAGLPLFAVGAHLQSKNRLKPIGLEALPVLFLTLSLTLAVLAWLLFVVPAQYFLFLIVGSLSRIALTSTAQIYSRIQSGQVELAENSSDDGPKPEDGWWDASMRHKPITLSSAFGAALLFLLSLFLR